MNPQIDNWFKMMDGLCGKITNHPNQESFSSDTQLTSAIKNIETDYDKWKEGDLVESMSGHTYKLGKKYETIHPDSKV